MIAPIRIFGFMALKESWNISCTSRRRVRRCARDIVPMSAPFSSTAPSSGRSSPTIRRPSVLLPHPDSPTRPNVSPALTERETSETAWTTPAPRVNSPDLSGYLRLTAERVSSDDSSAPSGAEGRSGARTRRSCADASAVSPSAAGTGWKQACVWPSPAGPGETARTCGTGLLPEEQRGAKGHPSARPIRAGGRPGNRAEPPGAVLVEPRHRRQQRLRVAVPGVREHLVRRRGLHGLARVHHDDPVRMPGHDSHVVRHEQETHPQSAVGDRPGAPGSATGWSRPGRSWARRRSAASARTQARSRSWRAASCHRTAGGDIRRGRSAGAGHADERQHLLCTLQRLSPGSPAMQPHRLPDLTADGHRGVEAGHRILEDHPDLTPPDLPHLGLGQRHQVAALETNRAMVAIRAPGGSSRTIDIAVMVLPHPDSPTSASVSPASMLRETPLTARTTPCRVAICVRRSSSCSNGEPLVEGISMHRTPLTLSWPRPRAGRATRRRSRSATS